MKLAPNRDYSIVGRFVVTVCFCLASPPSIVQTAYAQKVPQDLDVAGLKLGITMPEAETELKAHNSNLKFEIMYATEDPGLRKSWRYGGFTEKNGASLRDAKVKVPIALTAYDNDKQPHPKIEAFLLRFTPTDGGGRLYLIARYVRYPTPGETGPEMAEKYIGKYGKPTSRSNGSVELSWQYDMRGRLLSERSRDAFRCRMAAATSRDGGFPLDSPNINSGQGSPNFRQCGIHVEADSDIGGYDRLEGFVITLADPSLAGFDNGIEAYLNKKISEAGIAPPKSSAPPL